MEQTWESVLKELQQKYLAGMPARLETLSQILSNLEENPDNLELLSEARRIVHGFKGSGKQYGFPAISEQGKVMESVLVEVVENGFRLGYEEILYLRDRAGECRRIIYSSREGAAA